MNRSKSSAEAGALMQVLEHLPAALGHSAAIGELVFWRNAAARPGDLPGCVQPGLAP